MIDGQEMQQMSPTTRENHMRAAQNASSESEYVNYQLQAALPAGVNQGHQQQVMGATTMSGFKKV